MTGTLPVTDLLRGSIKKMSPEASVPTGIISLCIYFLTSSLFFLGLKLSSSSVSYTHLDVYKRQVVCIKGSR